MEQNRFFDRMVIGFEKQIRFSFPTLYRLVRRWEKSIIQMLRYLVTGWISAAGDFLTFLTASYLLHLHYQPATYSGLTVGLVLNYVLSKFWVFGEKRVNAQREFWSFVIVTAIGFALTGLFMHISVEVLGIYKTAARLIAMILVFIFNFLARKYFIWRD